MKKEKRRDETRRGGEGEGEGGAAVTSKSMVTCLIGEETHIHE